MIVVLAEKPSVAKDIAIVLGASKKKDGYWEGQGYQVTWALGHLVGIGEPHQIDARWKKWNPSLLPMIPEKWTLIHHTKTENQLEVIRKLMRSKASREIVCATDAGREGELIFRYIYQYLACSLPVKRLWISSLTAKAIEQGFRQLQPLSFFDGLGDSALGRSRADWLVGMNLSRAYSLANDHALSIGRVQTPTLAMIVQRDQDIEGFTPEHWLEVEGYFSLVQLPEDSWKGVWYDPDHKKQAQSLGGKPNLTRRLPTNGETAELIIERVSGGAAKVESIDYKTQTLAPPLVFDLTELQRQCSRLYGMTAARTLQVAQSLYEQKKMISYPRTDSRYLSSDMVSGLGKVATSVREPYESLIEADTGLEKPRAYCINDQKIGDHHGIIPTGVVKSGISSEESQVFDLICRQFLMIWQKDHQKSLSRVVTVVESDDAKDFFMSRGSQVLQLGWKSLEKTKNRGKKSPVGGSKGLSYDSSTKLPDGLAPGKEASVDEVKSVKKESKPPLRYTDATLLTAMETAGRAVEDKEASEAMKDNGLGTPATRAGIFETLLDRKYITREGKILRATDKGSALIKLVHPDVKSPILTGQWEKKLKQVAAGDFSLDDFSSQINLWLQSQVTEALSRQSQEPVLQARSGSSHYNNKNGDLTVDGASYQDNEVRGNNGRKTDVISSDNLETLLQDKFGFDRFRDYQQNVCRLVTEGNDVLVVMPTGAGKSLCYQLPGIARGGSTLVISPLIALIEDQVDKLKTMGFAAERIHSGIDRSTSRQICQSWIHGFLDFLFIAPERLGLPGFVKFMSKWKPNLIAVDEAHCISHWGHDFRPDYRMLTDRLKPFLPTPIIALTATATPDVQKDIVEQLNLNNSTLAIHGFRRTNIAIEIIKSPISKRSEMVLDILRKDHAVPAIVYASSRKMTEEIASELSAHLGADAYHAGLSAEKRHNVQEHFLRGKLDVIVATTAFGMGVDKADIRTVIHLALPASIEGYYQEIGRAGRDGKDSRAVLFFSYSDHKTQEFFHKKNYPEINKLKLVRNSIPDHGTLRDHMKVSIDEVDNCLEKLWIHDGIRVDSEEIITKGNSQWEVTYKAQKDYKWQQFQALNDFAENDSTCRMIGLINHFGDRDDKYGSCGKCDICAPSSMILKVERELNSQEKEGLSLCLTMLRDHGNVSAGKLHRETFESLSLDRDLFEKILGVLLRKGWIKVEHRTFEKEGKSIPWRSISMTTLGVEVRRADYDEIKILEVPQSGITTKTRKKKARKPAAKAEVGVKLDIDPRLLELLKKWRREEAQEKKLPAFCIMPDKTLEAIAGTRPENKVDMLSISGIGPAKFEKFGVEILKLVETHGGKDL